VRILLSDAHTSGGLSSHLVLLARHLVDRGHDVTAHLGHDGPRAMSWPGTGARVVTEGQLVDLVMGDRFDVINLTEDDPWLLRRAGVIASRSPVVLTVHSTRSRVRLDGVDRVVLVSEAFRTVTRFVGGHPPMTVIPNAIDTCRFRRDGAAEDVGAPRVALWIGRVSDRRKGVSAYLSAVAALGPGWRPWILTDPRQMGATDSFRAEHPRLRIESRAWEEMPGLLRGVARNGGCLVMSSNEEGDPLVIGEALACGLPVAAIRIAALDPWIEAGALAVADEPTRLAATVADAVGPARAERLAAAERVLHGPRSVERWVDAYERVYAEAAACRRPPVRRWLAAQFAGERRLDRAAPARPIPTTNLNASPVGAKNGLGVVVTTYRRPLELARCLSGIARLGDQVAAVCVVDNSPDPAPTTRPSGLAPAARFEVAGDGINRGLPAAIAIAFDRLRDCRRVLVLDDDTVPTPELLEALHDALDRGAGLAGLPDPFSLRHNRAGPPRLVGWSPCLLQRELIDDLGPPDARLFFGYDDYEYTQRAARAGWRVEWVRHELETQRLGGQWPERGYFTVRNSVWLATRRWPPGAPSCTIAAAAVRAGISVTVQTVRQGWRSDDVSRRTARAAAVGLAHGLLGRMGPPPAWVLDSRPEATS
jgi:glycosyltransferase involved in cell wall biosynthesis